MASNPMVSLLLELSKIYVIVLLGYVSSKNKMLTLEGKGRILSQIVSRFAAPATFFTAAATTDFSKFDILAVIGVFLGKIATLLCMSIPAFISGNGSVADSIASWGVYSLFTGMCTAVPMGYPILSALYPVTDANSDNIPQYVMAWAATRVALFAPICLAMLDYARVRKEKLRELMNNPQTIAATPPLQRTASTMNIQNLRQNVCCRTAYQVLTNPLVVGVILGLVINFSFGPTLPTYAHSLVDKIATPYKFLALFFLGFKAGLPRKAKEDEEPSYRDLILPIFLICFKLVVSAVITRLILEVMLRHSSLKNPNDMKTAAYIFASLPPSAFVTVIASEYNVAADLINSAQIASIFLCAPVLLLSTVVSGVWSPNTIRSAERTLSYVSHASSITSGIALVFGFYALRTWRNKPMDLILCLILFQILYSMLHATCDIVLARDIAEWMLNVIFISQYFCRIFCRAFTCCIALHLCLMIKMRGRVDFQVKNMSFYYFGGCVFIAAILSLFGLGLWTDSPLQSRIFLSRYKMQCQLWSIEQIWVCVITCLLFLSICVGTLIYVAMSSSTPVRESSGALLAENGDTKMDSIDPGIQAQMDGHVVSSYDVPSLPDTEDNSEQPLLDSLTRLSHRHSQGDLVRKTSEAVPRRDSEAELSAAPTTRIHPNDSLFGGEIPPLLQQSSGNIFDRSESEMGFSQSLFDPNSTFTIKPGHWRHSDHTCFDPTLHDKLNLDFYFRALIIICLNMVRELASLILGLEMLLGTSPQGGYISTLYLVVILVGTQGLVTSLVFVTTKDYRAWVHFKLRRMRRKFQTIDHTLGTFSDGV